MRPLFAMLLATVLLGAQDLSKLPDWARVHAAAAANEPVPTDADAWVLLDRTEMAYTGNGEVRTRKLRLVKVLTERGRSEGKYVLYGLGGRSSQIKKLKGWNLRPGGDLVKLDRDTVVTQDSDFFSDEVSTGTLTHVGLDQVEKGSLVAFESQEVFRHPMGPSDHVYLLQRHPVRRFELELARKEGWFSPSLSNVQIKLDLRHFEPWITPKQLELKPGVGLVAGGLPALPQNEGAHPHGRNMLPWVLVRFQDPGFAEWVGQGTWEQIGSGISKRYEPFLEAPGLTLTGSDPRSRIQNLHDWMRKELSYRMVYLSPERGWVPEKPAEVFRKRFGDCKDMATFLMAQARKEGMAVAPVLARIVDGFIEADEPVSVFAFNHVIAALRLDQSWGLPAEVDTPKGRFLLVDPTSPFTPLGWLPSGHRGRRLLVCAAEGGMWVEVPASACQPEGISFRLKGQVDLKGDLEAEFRILETGDALGLRSVGAFQGKGKLKDFVLRAIEDLPPTGSLELVDCSDPGSLDQPFEVRLKLKYPQGFRRSASEYALMPWGSVRVPGTIQKPGVPRRYPVAAGRSQDFHYQAEVDVPWSVVPILGTSQVDSPWRKGTWKAEVRPEKGAFQLVLNYQETRKPARFDFDKREEGVEAWKKDRNATRRIRQEGLVFRVSP